MRLQRVKDVCLRVVAVVLLAVSFAACHDGNIDKFEEKFAEGNLTEAQEFIAKISDHEDAEPCAFKLIKTYAEAGAVDKAVYVYEKITPWHKGRRAAKYEWNSKYTYDVCQLLRMELMKKGEYEMVLNYYPMHEDDENSESNAEDRFLYLSDVVDDMCNRGKQEEASKFVDKNLRWFVRNVDGMEDEYDWQIKLKRNYNSTAVREKLLEQIDNSY